MAFSASASVCSVTPADGLVYTTPPAFTKSHASTGGRPAGHATHTPPGGGDAVDCTNGCTALEGSTVAFDVSIGPVPDVAGETVDAATAKLRAVDLSATTTEEFSSDVDKGDVIRIADREGGGHFRPGDTVTLVVSKGPEPIQVPDVTGNTVAVAMQTLRDAGFEPGTALPEIVWGIFTVSGTSPAAGTLQPPGTKITVRSTG